jgi:hypothetical protein
MDLASEDEQSEEGSEPMNIDDLLEDINLEDFSDEEEGVRVLSKKDKEEEETVPQENKSKVEKVDKLLKAARKKDKVSYTTLSKMLQLFKKVTDDNSAYIGPQIYKLILDFSVNDLPPMIVKTIGLDGDLTEKMKGRGDTSIAEYLKTELGLKFKAEMIMRSYLANYINLLKEEASPETTEFYLIHSSEICKLALPFKTYARKLASSLVNIMAKYHENTQSAVLLAFESTRLLITWS